MNQVKKACFFALIISAFGINAVFSQSLSIDDAIASAVTDIRQSVPRQTKIAVVNIATELVAVSDYIVNELIVQLVNTHLFLVVPRSEVELQAAQNELGFQMSGFVSDESAKSLGMFLGAGTVITGNFSRDSSNTYRLIINAVDVESFFYQSACRVSIRNDSKMRSLAAGAGVNEDYTVGERLRTGTINIVFGLGSAMQGDKKWWIGGLVEGIGVLSLTTCFIVKPQQLQIDGKNNPYYDEEISAGMLIGSGLLLVGAGIAIGYIMPFFYQRPNNPGVALNRQIPLNLELVSSGPDAVDGIKISYTVKF
jgi:hypothetical protein